MVSRLASLGNDQNMGQISVEITVLPGSTLSGNQQPGDLAHLLADLGMVWRTFSPDRLGVDANQHTGTALRDLIIPHHAERCVPSLAWRRQTFPNRSFRIALSSTVSASTRSCD